MTTPGGGDLTKAVRYGVIPWTRGAGIELGRGPMTLVPRTIAVRERSDKTVPPTVAPHLWVDSFDDIGAHIIPGSLDYMVAMGMEPTLVAHRVANGLLKDGGHLVAVTEGGAFQVFTPRDGGLVEVMPPAKPEKSVCVVRYGGIGDVLQSAALFNELKAQGYHITFLCEPTGHELMKHDPRIDAFIVQDKDQVPNHELPEYWAEHRKKFDKWINLCESVEGTLIKLPGRADYLFPDALRHELCNHNYGEFAAKMAELPFHAEHKFFATPGEDADVMAFVGKIGAAANPGWAIGQKWVKPFVIMWALSGSSPDKNYPHMDAVIARILMEIPHAHVITVGDPACQILEVGWEEEPRVHRLSGEMKLRDSMALAQQCDLVIGPETGTLNAVAFEDCAKIVLLSHSSPENLTKHWVNTEAIAPENTPCWPCHRLHYTRDFCPEHPESGSAMCQFNKTPDRVWAAVQRAFVGSATVSNLLRPA